MSKLSSHSICSIISHINNSYCFIFIYSIPSHSVMSLQSSSFLERSCCWRNRSPSTRGRVLKPQRSRIPRKWYISWSKTILLKSHCWKWNKENILYTVRKSRTCSREKSPCSYLYFCRIEAAFLNISSSGRGSMKCRALCSSIYFSTNSLFNRRKHWNK